MADQHPDGVENAPGKTSAGGESAGGAYPDPKQGAKGGEGGFNGHGGQSEQDYSGPDNPNATAGGKS